MRLDSIRIHNIGVLRDVNINLAEIPPGLVALCGENGAGKSTILECYPGAMGFAPPTRDPLKKLARAADSFVEIGVVNGSPWTIRAGIDAVSERPVETLVTRADGTPAMDKTNTKAFAAWSRKHLPDREVFFASLFDAQGTSGFASMPTADQKRVMLKIIGVERLEGLAKLAREQASVATTNLAVVATKLTVAKAKCASLALGLDQELVETREAIGRCLAMVATCEAYEKAFAEVALHNQRADQNAQARAEVLRQFGANSEALNDCEQRIANNKAVLDNADKIRAAAERARELDAQIAKVSFEIDTAHANHRRALSEVSRLEDTYRDQCLARHDLFSRMERLNEDKARLVAMAPSRVAEVERELAKAQEELDAIRSEGLATSSERISFLRSGLEIITKSSSEGSRLEFAESTLRDDDAIVAAATNHPARLRVAQQAVANLVSQLRHEQGTDAIRARLEQVVATGSVLEADLAAARERESNAYEALACAKSAVGELDIAALRAQLSELKEAHTIAREEGKHINALERAEEALGIRLKQKAELTEQAHVLNQRLEAMPKIERLPLPEAPSVSLANARERHLSAVRALTLAESKAEALKPMEVEVALLEQEVKASEESVADWELLAQGLGKNGIQALLIDAACPQIQELTNDYLHAAFGSRFSVRVDTTRMAADGKRQIEDFEISVLDTQEGREGSYETFSGGEKVILGEAISLALTTMVCRRNGLSGVTLIRDESGAAVDAGRAEQYIKMLRRARELVGARHILFVWHNPNVQAMADTRILVANGTAGVMS